MIKIEWQPLPPASRGEEVSYFPRLKGNGSVDIDTLSKQAVKHQTVFSRGELLAAFDHLQHEMTDALAFGKAVKIPGFGTFRLVIEANGKVSAKQRSRKDAVRLKTVSFTPDDDFLQSLGQLCFRSSNKRERQSSYNKEEMKARLTDYLAQHSTITCPEFAELFLLGRSTANKRVKELLDEGFLVRTGTGRYFSYSLSSPVQ